MSPITNNKFIQLFFFSNHFYGLCAIALAIEANLQMSKILNSFLFYLILYCGTVAYYLQASIQTELSVHSQNSRSYWYSKHFKLLRTTQYVLLLILFLSLIWISLNHFSNILNFSFLKLLALFLFPFIAFFYYGVEIKFFGRYALRRIGWLKPFLIGFTWAGIVTIVPSLFNKIENKDLSEPSCIDGFIFIQNFMYISVLSILFDIKDYAMDHNAQLKTLVLKFGLRSTLLYIIIPLTVLGLCSYYMYALLNQLSMLTIFFNTLPFLLLMIVSFRLISRRSIFYYLFIIDGLMLVKALCGITAIKLF